MTRYTVVWVQSVEDELVEIWLASEDRNEITAATNSIDHELRNDADLKGDEVSEGLRALNAPPIRVVFTVRADDRVVEIVSVRRI